MKYTLSLFLVIICFLSSSCATKFYEPSEVIGRGVIEVNSGYTIYQNVTRTREVYVPGVTRIGAGSGVEEISPSSTRTETYTESIPVRMDRKLSFVILEDNIEVFKGVTPIKVTNFDPGVRYIIVWRSTNGVEKRAWFEIPTSKPFTQNIYID